MKLKKLLPQILLLLIIDVVLIWIWILKLDPTPSGSLVIIILVPFVCGVNLIIAGLFYFINKEIMKLFLINSILSSICMFILFGEGIDRHMNENLDRWDFELSDTTYSIYHWKNYDSTFSISYRTDPSFSVGFLYGELKKNENEIILFTDSTEYRIRNNYLIGFRRDSLKLDKIKW